MNVTKTVQVGWNFLLSKEIGQFEEAVKSAASKDVNGQKDFVNGTIIGVDIVKEHIRKTPFAFLKENLASLTHVHRLVVHYASDELGQGKFYPADVYTVFKGDGSFTVVHVDIFVYQTILGSLIGIQAGK